MGNLAIVLNQAFSNVAFKATAFACAPGVLNTSLMGVESFVETGRNIFLNFLIQAKDFLWTMITNVFYFICRFILNILDFLFVIVQELAGQNSESIINSTLAGDASTKDIMLRFLFSPTTVSVLKSIFIFSIVLLIIFTIIALIRTEYLAVVNNQDGSKMPVFRNVLKSLFAMLFVPVIAIGGIIVSNSVLAAISRAIGGTNSTSISTQVFMASAYESNRYRTYANNNKKIPIFFNFRELNEGDNITESPGGDTVKEMEANMERFLKNSTALDLGAQTYKMFSSAGFFNMTDVKTTSLYYNLYDNTSDGNKLITNRDEYFVMADVIDFIMKSGRDLYIRNAQEVLLNTDVANEFSITYAQEGLTKYTTVDGAKNEADGAKYLICYKDEQYTNGAIRSKYIPLKNGENEYHTVNTEDHTNVKHSFNFGTAFSNKNDLILARGVFDAQGYPTAIYDEGNKVGFYRDVTNVPLLYDLLPVISYEPRPDLNLSTGYKVMNFLTTQITGLKLSDFVPYIYYRFDIMSVFSKEMENVVDINDGKLELDYNFTSKITMENVYNTADINYLILVLSLALLFGVLLKAMWGFISRIFDVIMLYLSFPAIASTFPLDNGDRVKKWGSAFISKLFMAYGFVIMLNLIFILSDVIFNIQFINSADLTNSMQLISNYGLNEHSQVMAVLAGSLNFLIQVMFLLVLFSMLKTGSSGAKMLNTMIGVSESDDLLKKGQALQQNTKAVFDKGMSFVNGKAAVNAANKLIGTKDETGQRTGGLINAIPGINVMKSVKDRRDFGKTLSDNRIVQKDLKASYKSGDAGEIERSSNLLSTSNSRVKESATKYEKRDSKWKAEIKSIKEQKKKEKEKKKAKKSVEKNSEDNDTKAKEPQSANGMVNPQALNGDASTEMGDEKAQNEATATEMANPQDLNGEATPEQAPDDGTTTV